MIRDENMNGVDIVVHVATLKHVPLWEYNSIEVIRTNVDGAINVIDAVIDNDVDRVIMISTDKAVHPVNL
jgi:FlaA1/EpsC-like NDP-sugar epimerase